MEDVMLDIFTPRNLTEALEFAKMVAAAQMCPKGFEGKPGDIVIAWAKGAEIGLRPMTALESIAVINGRPTLWGDAGVALVRVHPDFEDMDEGWDEERQEAWCVITRKGQTPQRRTFSLAEAVAAKLTSKSNTPWASGYAKRMCSWRAKSWAMRDVFADALRGLSIREEIDPESIIEKDITPPKEELKQLPEAAGGEAAPSKIVGSDGQPVRSKADRVMEKIGTFGSGEPGNRFAGATEKGVGTLSRESGKPKAEANGFTPSLEQLQFNLREAKTIEDVNAVLDAVRSCSDTVRQQIMQETARKIAEIKAGKTEGAPT